MKFTLSDEQRKLAESIAQKTQAAREFVKDEKTKKKFMEAMQQMTEGLLKLQEKQKYGPLNDEELELLVMMEESITAALSKVQDAKLLIGNSLMVAATTQFFHVKKLAEEGHEDAKKMYEKLRPGFERAMAPKANGPHNLN